MSKKLNQKELIIEFIKKNATDGYAGEAKIVGNQLIHFETPIIERYKDGFILNTSNYSDITRFLQRKIREVLQDKKVIEVNKVLMGYEGSLVDYINKK